MFIVISNFSINFLELNNYEQIFKSFLQLEYFNLAQIILLLKTSFTIII